MKKMMKYLVMVLLFISFAHCNAQTVPSAVDSILLDSILKNKEAKAILEKQIAQIDLERNVYGNFFDRLEGMTNSFSNHLTFLSGFLAIISSVMLILQVIASRRDNKAMKEMSERMDKQDANNERLLNAVTTNIASTSSFIDTYKNLIEIKQTSDEVNKKIALMDEKEKKRLNALTGIQKKINSKAVRLLESVFKAEYSSSFFNKADLHKFDSFFIEASSHLAHINENEDVKRYFSSAIYFIMGLSQYLSNQPVDTEKYLKLAKDKLTKVLGTELDDEVVKIMYSDEENFDVHGGINKWHGRLAHKCDFYLGLINYKQGEFKRSIVYFKSSIKRFPHEIDSIFYLFQARYWQEEYQHISTLTEGLIEAVDTAIKASMKTEIEKSNMFKIKLYTRIGDFYRGSEYMADSQKDEYYKLALEFYHKGYELINKTSLASSVKTEQLNKNIPINYFGFAKVLQEFSKSGEDYGPSPTELYKQAEKKADLVIGSIENEETRYILHYIRAYCLEQLGKYDDACESIDDAFDAFKDYYSHINYYCYSPISNLMRPKSDIETEILEYRARLIELKG